MNRFKSTAVYGPPGTGKTTWLMNKITQIMESGVDPHQIMYLSFTKAAAAEAIRRMGVKTNNVSTIHSACYRLCQMSGSSVVNYSKLMKFGSIIGMPFRGNSDDAAETMEIGDVYLALHSLARNRMRPIDVEYDESSRPGSWAEFEFFVKSYDDWKSANGLIDFTDMLEDYDSEPRPHGCVEIIVDESQDLSPLQWSVVRKMAAFDTVKAVYFAGDDDQAIFEWAGANPHGMAEFEEETDSERVVLGQSYRVPQAVHSIVTSISDRLMNRVNKQYLPRDEIGKVVRDPLYNCHDQKEGFILCRTHSIKQKVERELIEGRVPFLSDGGGLPGPFNCKAAKAVRAWKRSKDAGAVSQADLELMIAAATEAVRSDLVAGDYEAVFKRDPMKAFKMMPMFAAYFRDVDIYSKPMLVTCTIHGSKGREADEVTLITDWTNRVAAGMSMNPDQEHRVFYVGASRAKKVLRLTSVGGDGYCV